MESALVVLRNICGPEDKNVLETVFKGCLPLIYEQSTLDIIILEHFDSAELLDSTLLMLYNLAREVLLTRDLVDTSINVLFNQPAEKFNERKWDIAFFSETSLSSLFRYHVGRFFTMPIPKIARIKQDVDRNRFKVSALGGTFDHLHDGHKILLSVAALITSSKLIIGVTDQELLKAKKYKELLEPFQKRCDNVCNFLGLLRDSLEVKVFPLHDVCGPTGTEPEIESLIVSRETVSGGNFVNKTRKERGLQELEIYVVNVLGGDESDGWKGKLSSTVIRKHHAKKPSR